jgi:D-alanyl-D-alanine carboxypeptidase/D-alanyl-D-alanine-endopeptidase (penicillin-binding protein 4)
MPYFRESHCPSPATTLRIAPFLLLGLFALLCVAHLPAQTAPLAQRLDQLWKQDPFPDKAFAGLVVLDPANGRVIFSRNGSRLFTPASNTKLFSTALALTKLGPEHRMETEVRAEGELFEDAGLLRGDLVLVGKGDPSIRARTFPYSKDTARQRDYSLPAMEDLANAVVARGILIIEGDVIGDDTAYLWEPFREGWAQDDALYAYGAPVSALTLNDNMQRILVVPGMREGEPARLSLQPDLEYFDILNEVQTTKGAKAALAWERLPGRLLLFRGALPPGAPPRVEQIAVDDPALFAAEYFRQALLRRGVEIRGVARARHRMSAEHLPDDKAAQHAAPHTVIHIRLSPPLSELITVVNKESQNLHAELLLCEVSRAQGGVGSRTEAIAELRRFLASIGASLDGIAFADASGLARMNLISPEVTARLLAAMWNGNHRQVWLHSLPIGGKDGTLSGRFGESVLGEAISAKTGTLRGVAALSGYARTKSGKVLVFSAMVNNHGGPSREAREFIDKLALEVAGTP